MSFREWLSKAENSIKLAETALEFVKRKLTSP